MVKQHPWLAESGSPLVIYLLKVLEFLEVLVAGQKKKLKRKINEKRIKQGIFGLPVRLADNYTTNSKVLYNYIQIQLWKYTKIA